ncbi:hypothetical protein J6590_032910 [Homalodisca vitripennis]|nr:hypothetical protein J6590_032910 [Homalodisca vitripennis]
MGTICLKMASKQPPKAVQMDTGLQGQSNQNLLDSIKTVPATLRNWFLPKLHAVKLMPKADQISALGNDRYINFSIMGQASHKTRSSILELTVLPICRYCRSVVVR